MADMSTPEERARRRTEEWEGLWWHIAAYVVINTFLWGLDWLTGGGIEWAYWVTFPWLIGLSFHIAAYVIEVRGARDHKYDEFLRRELERDAERSDH